jgi:uncharacterized membrane protein YgdD (TMEM256/DUF423 family)
MSDWPGRGLVVLAGLSGAAGVALAARAAHMGGVNMETAARFLLLHAPVLMAVGMVRFNRVMTASAAVLAVGVALFAADLVMRESMGTGLFAYAAPIGGIGMMVGWAGIAAAGVFKRVV